MIKLVNGKRVELTDTDAEIFKGMQTAAAVSEPIPTLNLMQWNYLLGAADVRDIAEAAINGLAAQAAAYQDAVEDYETAMIALAARERWAAINATILANNEVRWEQLVAFLDMLRANGGVDVPSDNELLWYWGEAAKFEGLQ